MDVFRAISEAHKSKNSYLLYVGSGSTAGSLVTFHEERPRLEAMVRTPITFQPSASEERLEKEMLASLRHSTEKLQRETHDTDVAETHIVMGSPWHLSQTHTVKVAREQPMSISEHFLEELTEQSRHSFQKTLSEENNKKGEYEYIEHTAMQTVLNGYHTNRPFGKVARQIEVSLFFSAVPKRLTQTLRQQIEESLHTRHSFLHSFALASFLVVRDLYQNEDDFMLVDIDGETVDVALVRDGVLLESVSLRMGRNYLLRELSSRLGTVPEEAHSLIQMSQRGKVNEEDVRSTTALKEVEERWLAGFERACRDLATGERLPTRVFLTAPPDTRDWFARTMARDECGAFTLAGEPFKVTKLHHQLFAEHLSLAPGLQPEPFLELGALFVHRLHHSKDE